MKRQDDACLSGRKPDIIGDFYGKADKPIPLLLLPWDWFCHCRLHPCHSGKIICLYQELNPQKNPITAVPGAVFNAAAQILLFVEIMQAISIIRCITGA